MTHADLSLLEIGHVVKGHGLRGEVVVRLVTNMPGRLDAGARLSGRPRTAAPRDSLDTGRAEPGTSRELVVLASRPFQDCYLVMFDGISTRDQADSLRGVRLLAPREEDEDALFVHDLIGAEVVEVSGTARGRVVAVEANPASDLLVGEDGWLIPLRFVVERRGSKIIVDAPEGLFD